MRRRGLGVCVAGLLLLSAGASLAETADTVLFNGKVLTVDKDFAVQEAIAIGHGRVLATGNSTAMKALADAHTRVIDLGGRTVIPGLTDGHIHGVRAALTFGTEVNWIGVPTLREALDKIRAAAAAKPPGSWIVVAGGWTEEQFAEKRRPAPQEIAAAAPDNPVYIQHLYDWLLLSPKAMEALNIRDDADVAPGGKLERDGNGRPTGVIVAGGAALGKIFDRLPKPTLAQQVEGSQDFFREMNSLGITGIVDGGGVSMYPANYQALFKLWRDKKLTVRVAYHLCAPKPGSELADLQNLTQLLPQGFGDDMLHFNGPGEILIWADWTDGDITADGKARLAELLRWAASKGHTIQLHWNPDRTVHDLLDVIEDINKDTPVRNLRWTVLHLYNASEDNLKRMLALGLIWGVQDGLYFGGERLQQEVGAERAREMPRIATALKLGLTVAAGTDAHRVSSYNPFVSLQWYLDGTTIGGTQTRGEAEAPSRPQALTMYTRNSAFMANDDDKRGTLEAGKYADLAVLSADYLTVPVKEIGNIRSLLTMVGGDVVYAAAPFKEIEVRAGR
ncbi:Twin-arginine translocation pathway signal precursor [Bradyrhizobium sp. STM 3843]|uniref:amidohydrolase n=1 Tax=Bradyrhizobium sp. STM 3843 TaxID=551947 RepID=UPI0002403FED|nr:amidohydrolase [Bradyrhizobium sp. STM 3843]CCE08551.1 Twin-arginine translocation pathway signal precursor [Bradyrhizobium sp. STM 3843]